MENLLEQPKTQQLHRPTFLTVLCILTFIGSGWNILESISTLFTAGAMQENSQLILQEFSNMQDADQVSAMAQLMGSSIEYAKVVLEHSGEIAAMQLVLGILSLLGAILMFQLRRVGYYLYVAAQILLLFVYPYFAGFTAVVVLIMGTSAFISLLFILLYTINLKHLH